MVGEILHELGVASAEQDVVADEGGAEEVDDLEDGTAPAFFAAAFEAGEAYVFFVGSAVFVGEVG